MQTAMSPPALGVGFASVAKLSPSCGLDACRRTGSPGCVCWESSSDEEEWIGASYYLRPLRWGQGSMARLQSRHLARWVIRGSRETTAPGLVGGLQRMAVGSLLQATGILFGK